MNQPNANFPILEGFFRVLNGSIPASIASAIIANSSSIVSGGFNVYSSQLCACCYFKNKRPGIFLNSEEEVSYSIIFVVGLKLGVTSRRHG